jgi:hypothetical protein
MAYAIKKLDGSTEFTITDAEWDTMQAGIAEDGRVVLPNAHKVWMYNFTEANKASLLTDLVSEHGSDTEGFRVGHHDSITLPE